MQGSFSLGDLNFTCCKAVRGAGSFLKPTREEGFSAPVFAADRLEAASTQGNSRELGVDRDFELFHSHRKSGEPLARYCASAKRWRRILKHWWARPQRGIRPIGQAFGAGTGACDDLFYPITR